MSVEVLERTEERSADGRLPEPAGRMVLYGDFNCPWSYLASRRAAVLAAAGVRVDWRAVEHDAPSRRSAAPILSRRARLGRVLDEMQQVLRRVLPGEELPYALAGFVPDTTAAVTAYAEAYRAGVAGPVRQVLFEASWLHAFDLGDPCVIHTLVVDAVRSGGTGCTPLPAWDYGSGAGHDADEATRRLLDRWTTSWADVHGEAVPTLVVDGEVLHGVDAVDRLGAELVSRGLLTVRR
jgi:2-hydroxychromene-2-carboxylate isomerase